MRNPRYNLTSLSGVIVIGILAHSQVALFAREGGAGTRGGGDALVCTIQSGDVSFSKTYLADTYRLKVRDQIKDLAVFNSLSKKQIEKALWKQLEKESEAKYDDLRKHYKMLEFKQVAMVPEVDDDNLENLPTECTKVQLAVQYFSEDKKRKNLVEVAQPLEEEMSRLEQGLLPIHEAYLRKQRLENPSYDDTRPVRAKVRGLMADAEMWDSIIRKLYIQVTGREPSPGYGPRQRAFLDAIKRNAVEEVLALLKEQEVDVNAIVAFDSSLAVVGYRPIDFAQSEAVALLLLEAGGSFAKSFTKGTNLIFQLSKMDDLAAIEKMIALGAEPNHCSGYALGCGLIEAIQKDRNTVFEYLLKFPIRELPRIVSEAACASNPRYLEQLLTQFPELDLNPRKGREHVDFPLHRAVRCGRLEQVRFLVEKGAKINNRLEIDDDATPMQMARRRGFYEIATYLESMGGKMGRKLKWDAAALELRKAVLNGDENLAIALLEEGLSPEVYTGSLTTGRRPYGHPVESTRDSRLGYDTPLMLFAKHSMFRGLETCIKHGATLDRVDHQRRTALHWAASEDKLDAAKFLVRNGATVNLMDRQGNTATTLARKGSATREFLKTVGGVEFVE